MLEHSYLKRLKILRNDLENLLWMVTHVRSETLDHRGRVLSKHNTVGDGMVISGFYSNRIFLYVVTVVSQHVVVDQGAVEGLIQ